MIEHNPIEEIRKAIDDLRKMDLRSVEIDYLKDHISCVLKGYICSSPILHKGLELYRGIKWNEKPVNVSQVSLPPADKVVRFGRVNRIGKPVFYASASRNVVFFEQRVKVGDTITVSRWRTKKKMIVNNIGYTPEVFQTLGSNRQCPIWGKDKIDPRMNSETNVLIRQFFADEFTRIIEDESKNHYLYKLSIAIGEKFWHGDLFQGIIYPSLAMKANSDNITVKSECVDEYLELEEIEHIRIDKKNNELNYDITILDTSGTFDKDGAIIWRGGLPQWTLKKGEALEVKAEKGRWVAKDDKGNEAKPAQASSSGTSVNGSTIITPLRHYFVKDFNNFLNTAAERKVTNVKTGDHTAYPVRVHFDFDNYSKFVTIYIPSEIDPFAIINFYINDISQALKVGDGVEVHQSSDDNTNTTSSKDLAFNGSLFVYTEADLAKKYSDDLVTHAKKKGIKLIIRGSHYLAEHGKRH